MITPLLDEIRHEHAVDFDAGLKRSFARLIATLFCGFPSESVELLVTFLQAF